MASFAQHTHIEDIVEALQLTVESQSTIAKALNEPAVNLELALLTVTFNSAEGLYEFQFRYKTESTISALNAGDYLVRLNDGNYMVMSEADFESTYINTSVDPIIPAADRRTAKQAVVEFIQQFFPSAGITSEDQLTSSVLQQVANGLVSWYDAKNDIFDVKFTDCGMTTPEGLADILLAFPAASYCTPETCFRLNFNNGAYHEADIHKTPNQFNLIALQQLLGEIKKIPANLRKRIIGMDFMSVGQSAPSAIAPSVTYEQWQEWCMLMVGYTNIGNISNIRR